MLDVCTRFLRGAASNEVAPPTNGKGTKAAINQLFP